MEIIEEFGLEGAFKDYLVHPPNKQQLMVHFSERAKSKAVTHSEPSLL